MYTAKINRKDYVNGVVRVFVDFTNGTDVYTEACIPQDEDGLKFWVKSRLAAFNVGEVVETNYTDGADIDVSDPVVTPPTPTQAELDRDEWLKDYRKYTKVKTTLVDTGILTGNEAWFVTLRNKVTTNLLPAYLDLI